jgi:PRTRC genetic system protein B
MTQEICVNNSVVLPIKNELPTFSPKFALVLYDTDSNEGKYQNDYDAFVVQHDICSDDSGNTVLGSGISVSHQDVENLFNALLKSKKSGFSLLSKNVVSISSSHIAWVVKSEKHRMLFNFGKKKQELQVTYPNLFMVATIDNGFHIAAFKGSSTNIKESTPLYHSPIMNVFNDGSMCTGGAVLPKSISNESLAEWESLVFDTAFSHVNHQHTIIGTKQVSTEKLFSFWRKMKAQDKFPNEQLNPMNTTVGRFLERILG